MGYAGGTSAAPTYRDLGDHAEAIQVDFDPAVVSYRELLEVFWTAHDPCARSYSRQYASAILVHDEEQRRAAEETAAAVAELRGRPVRTEIAPLDRFHLAEAYHQKYRLRRLAAVEAELEAIYPELDDFVRSTAVTRANAIAAGSLDRARFDALAADLGLSDAALETLASCAD